MPTRVISQILILSPSQPGGRQYPQFSGEKRAQLSASKVRKSKENKGVPADHTEIEQVSNPHEFPNPKNDKYGNHLTEQDTPGGDQKAR